MRTTTAPPLDDASDPKALRESEMNLRKLLDGFRRFFRGSRGGRRFPGSMLIVDDSGVALESLGNFITGQPGLRVAAVATSGLDALKQLARTTVDLVLVDLNMPGMDGLELSRRIKALPSLPRVILTSVQNSAAGREAAEEAGADGFVAKSEMGTSFMPLVNRLFPSSFKDPSV